MTPNLPSIYDAVDRAVNAAHEARELVIAEVDPDPAVLALMSISFELLAIRRLMQIEAAERHMQRERS